MEAVLVIVSICIGLMIINRIWKSRIPQKKTMKRKFRTYRVVKTKHRDVWYEEVFTSL